MAMDENRVVDLILLVVLFLGTAGLAAFYFATSDHHLEDPTSVLTRMRPPQPKNMNVSSSRLSLKVNEPAGTTDRSDQGSVPPFTDRSNTGLPETNEKRSRSGLLTTASNGAAPPIDQTTKVSAAPTSTPRPAGKTVDETSKANGNFSSAQGIEKGIIVGQRGSAGDRADYYRVRAAGQSMSLRLVPSLNEGKSPFMMAVFDGEKRLIKKDPSAVKVAVVPEATYYIKLDLRNVPIETSQYHLHIAFN